MNLLQLNNSNSIKLEAFLKSAGNSLATFRYFQKRPLSVISNHLVTYLLEDHEGKAIAYAHLDKEDETIWLGAAVAESSIGKGYGKIIVTALLNFASTNNVSEIKLSVDNDNIAAIKLYEKHGFVLLEQREKIKIYIRKEISVYVSTLAFAGKSVEEIIQTAVDNNLAVEFSSGLPYKENMDEIYLSAPVKRMPHNYFPAPERPFVINLGSTNDEIRFNSIQHCKKGLELSKKSGAPFYSAHAGFCIDPRPEQLGNPLEVNVKFKRKNNWDLFVSSVKTLANYAEEIGSKFLIENNVVAAFNLTSKLENPLFCCNSDEIIQLVDEVNHPAFGILLDTAHFKVSSKTLSFDMHQELLKLTGAIKCIHHSDNNGEKDTNNSITQDYWFLKHMQQFRALLHVLEVKEISVNEIKEQINILKFNSLHL